MIVVVFEKAKESILAVNYWLQIWQLFFTLKGEIYIR